MEVAWLTPQSEYRPTEYLQAWVKFWFDDALRLHAAKQLQTGRLQRLLAEWNTRALREAGFAVDAARLQTLVQQYTARIAQAPDVTALLTDEAQLTKALFKLAVDAVGYGEFTRAKRGTGTDAANRFLDHGNYLAYGLGATATWVLGLPHGLAVLHGKSDAEVQAKIDAAWTQLIHGRDEDQRLYYPVGGDQAYIADVGNGDVRSEGMSYGLMLAVQLDKRTEFDRLWRWVKTHMYHAEGPRHGYFAWQCRFDGTHIDPGSASDGEEWFAMTLLFAANRWGAAPGDIDYAAEAQSILDAMRRSDRDGQAGQADGAQALNLGGAFAQCRVVGVDSGCEGGIRKRVFVSAADKGLAGQGGQALQRGVHLRRRY